MTTPNRPQCTVNGRHMYYNIRDIRDVTANKVVKGAFEAKFLIDTVEAIKGQCFTVHQHCKGLYPEVKGPEAGKRWLTSVDQDNDISLQQTLDKSDIPILYNTPRFCDPGITKSRNWSLKNYIQTRLYLYKRILNNKNGNNALNRNSSKCYSSVVFDFRPFVFTMKLPVETNQTSGKKTADKKLYFLQWMEIESGSAYGYKANTAIYDNEQDVKNQMKNRPTSSDFFKQLILNYSKKGMTGQSPTNINRNAITIENNQLDGFMNFLMKHDGIKFGGTAGNLNVKRELPSITLTDDILRMFYFDLMHDLGSEKVSPKFKKLTYIEFKGDLISEFRKLTGVHKVTGFAGAGTTGNSYETYETLLKKSNTGNTKEIPAIFKTVGDLSQYLYAAKYGTSVASGDRMGIAVGLYTCAKIGIPVKTMIEDGITGFILYTGRKDVKLSGGSSCKKSNNGTNACSRNAKTTSSGTVITETLSSTPRIAQQMAIIESRKPKLPSSMKSLISLWSNSAKVINVTGVKEIIETIKAFDGYWSENDLKKFLNIVQTLQKRNNIKPNSELGRKLNVLRGEFGGRLPNAPSATRAGTSISPVKLTNNQQNFINFMSTFRVFTSDQKKTYLNLYNKSTNKNSLRVRIKKESYKIKIRNMSGLNNSQKAQYNKAINNAPNNTRLNVINKEARASNNRARRVQQRTGSN
jgi:hypothetical protein